MTLPRITKDYQRLPMDRGVKKLEFELPKITKDYQRSPEITMDNHGLPRFKQKITDGLRGAKLEILYDITNNHQRLVRITKDCRRLPKITKD